MGGQRRCQLAAEYDTIAQAAQHDRWATLLAASGVTVEQVEDVLDSDACGALSAELRHAGANHHDLDALLPRLVAARSLDDADDIASVLHARVARATARPAGSGRTRKSPRLIAGLIPHAGGQMADDMRQALDERRELIEARADAVLRGCLAGEEPWTADLGTAARGEKQKAAWWRAARTVAAYRDRYGITDDRMRSDCPSGAARDLGHELVDAVGRDPELIGDPVHLLAQSHRVQATQANSEGVTVTVSAACTFDAEERCLQPYDHTLREHQCEGPRCICLVDPGTTVLGDTERGLARFSGQVPGLDAVDHRTRRRPGPVVSCGFAFSYRDAARTGQQDDTRQSRDPQQPPEATRSHGPVVQTATWVTTETYWTIERDDRRGGRAEALGGRGI